MVAYLCHEEKGHDIALLQDVLDFGSAQSRVYRDEYQASLGCTHLQQYPFGQIDRPDRDMISFLESQGHQATRYSIGLPAIFLVGPTNVERTPKLRITGIDHGFLLRKLIRASI